MAAIPKKRNRRSPRLVSIIIITLVALAASATAIDRGAVAGNGPLASRPAQGVKGDGKHYLGRQPVSAERARQLRESTREAPPPRFKGRSLPSSVNLSSELPPVGDQGSQGSCVAWACVYYQKTHSEKKFEHTSWDLNNQWYQFSPSFIYNQGGGGYPQNAYPLLETKGCVDIAEMPYDDEDFPPYIQPTAAQLEAAKPYKIQDNYSALWNHLGVLPPYSPANPIEDAKAWLADGYVLSSGIYVGPSFPDYGTDPHNPPAVYYDPGSGTTANHQVCICGYDDNINPTGAGPDHQGGFLMVNSWGPDWNGGMNGYLWLSYDWVKRYVEDCWVIHDVSPDDPYISGISTSHGKVGDPVTMTGSNFGTNRRSSGVTFNGVSATITNFTNGSITANIPAGATSGPLVVKDWEGTSSNQVNFYIGEFPQMSGLSPSSGPAGTDVTIQGEDFGATKGSSFVKFGSTTATAYPSWSATRIKVKVPEAAGGSRGSGTTVNVTVTSTAGTSNAMEFTITEAPVTYPTWYLAEGTTDWGFDTYISIENPNEEAVTAEITYMTGEGEVPGGSFTLPAMSQATVNPADTLGEKDFSTKVDCIEGKTIAVDRTLTWTGEGASSPEGHSSVGVTSPATTWYLPEGSSKWGFETWLLIQNPGTQDANVTVTYMIEGSEPKTVKHAVPKTSRQSYSLESEAGRVDASIKVESDRPVIPERAMYRDNRREGHDSIGTTTPVSDYYLAEGTTAWGFTSYVLVQNPNPTPADVTITYMTPTGPVYQVPFQMSANSRKTIRVNDELPNTDLSTHVHGSQPIIAERAMYWDNGTGEACHDSIGMSSAHTNFYLPDGQAGDGYETWTLVANPNDTSVKVQVSYLTHLGTENATFEDTVPAGSRKTYSMADKGIAGRAAILVESLNEGRKIMVERAMYWNSRGAGTDTIGGYSD